MEGQVKVGDSNMCVCDCGFIIVYRFVCVCVCPVYLYFFSPSQVARLGKFILRPRGDIGAA